MILGYPSASYSWLPYQKTYPRDIVILVNQFIKVRYFKSKEIAMEHHKDQFNSIGWFIPPYVSRGFLDHIYFKIQDEKAQFSQDKLETLLSQIYSPESLSAMVLHRYPIVPYVNDYSKIISEAVLAHFSGLDHVAVAGIMPAIEGIGLALAKSRRIALTKVGARGKLIDKSPRELFSDIADSCKEESRLKNIGLVEEIAMMMDSFKCYMKDYLYINSKKYPHLDNTNRNGILHGAFADKDYGSPINFYKAIAVINFLCFVSSFQANISWFAPNPTIESKKLAKYYLDTLIFSNSNPSPGFKVKIDSRVFTALIEDMRSIHG